MAILKEKGLSKIFDIIIHSLNLFQNTSAFQKDGQWT